MIKRGFVDVEKSSPEPHGFKRRRSVGQPLTPSQHCMFGNFVPVNSGALTTKRRRQGENDVGLVCHDKDSVNGLNDDMLRLRTEVHDVKVIAAKKVQHLELVGRNLQRACEQQAEELRSMSQENKLLKKSLLTLNGKREDAEKELVNVRTVVQTLRRQCQDLEQANMALCMRCHNYGGSICRQNKFDGENNGGGGHIY